MRKTRESLTNRRGHPLRRGRGIECLPVLSFSAGAILSITSPATAQTPLNEDPSERLVGEPPASPDTDDQEDSDIGVNEWAALTLEELMNVQISRREPMGIHHTHSKGEWMIHASSMFMRMDDNRDGTSAMSDAEVLDDFPIAPTRMESQMYMLGAMHAPTDRLTFMTMVPYMRKSMDHVMRNGMTFTTKSEGLGDVRVAALHTAWQTSNHKIHVDFGLSIPTGSINEKGTTPAGRVRLPYPMQLGSGTWDLLPGVTYQGYSEAWSWGANINGTIRLGRNDNEYRLGDRLLASAWGSYTVADSLSVHLRLDGHVWKNIHGADPQLNPMMVATANPNLRGGERIDLGIGINLFAGDDGPLNGHRLSCEFAVPIYQSLNGPQLETDWIVRIGWNWQF